MKKNKPISNCDHPRFNAGLSLFLLMLLIFTTACSEDYFDKSDATLKASNTEGTLYFGHQIFTRMSSEPQSIRQAIENPDFEHFEDNFTLFIQNGDSKATRVTSAVIIIDGVPILVPSDFSKKTAFISKELSGLTPTSTMDVKLFGDPGSFIDLWIEGTLKPGMAYIDEKGGVLISEDNVVILKIMPGTVEKETLFKIVESDEEPPSAIITNNLGKSYQLEPEGIEFNLPVNITMHYEGLLSEITNPVNLNVLHWNQSGLIESITVNNSQTLHQIDFNLESFSLISLAEGDNLWNVYNFKWGIREIKWYLVEENTECDSYLTAENIEFALNAWAGETSSFTFDQTFDKESANIIFNESCTLPPWKIVLLGNLAKVFLPGGLTCYGFYPEDLTNTKVLTSQDHIHIYLASGTIESQASEAGYTEYQKNMLAIECIAHEIGHALGIAHSTILTEKSIMVSQPDRPWDGLHKLDIDALHYHYLPRFASELVLSEDFESYNPGSFPYSWIPDGNGSDFSTNYVDNTLSYLNNKSLRLFGYLGSCWAAIAYHEFELSSPFYVELAIRNGTEYLFGCNPYRAKIGLRYGTSWTFPERELLRFLQDGSIIGGGGKNLGTSANNSWHLIRIKFESLTSSTIRINYWIDEKYLGYEKLPSRSSDSYLDHFELCALEGSAWFDYIRIYK